MRKQWMEKRVKRLLAMLLCMTLVMEPMSLRTFAMEDASDEYATINAESGSESNPAGTGDGEEKTPQNVISGEEDGMQWSIDADGLLTITGTAAQESAKIPAWTMYAGEIKSVKVTAKNVQYTANWFYNCKNLKSVDFSGFDTGNVKRMYSMFSGCSGLESLDLSGFNTGNVTSMRSMFSGCSSLTSLNLSAFNTGNVTSMSSMFEGCSSLTSLNLSSFNTGNVTSMNSMFYGCNSLTSLNLSSFDTDRVTDMCRMFGSCSSLESVNLSGFSTGNVTNMNVMFSGCGSLGSLDLSSFDTSSVTNMNYMFQDCGSLESLDLSNFSTGNVTAMVWMFAGCSNLKSLNMDSFDTSNVTAMTCIFQNCSSLESLNISHFDVSKTMSSVGSMFEGCSSLIELDLSFVDLKGQSGVKLEDCLSLERLMTPLNLNQQVSLPVLMQDDDGKLYRYLPERKETSICLTKFTAEPGETVASGVYYGMDWIINGDGQLTISGEYQKNTMGTSWFNYEPFITSAKVTAKKVGSTEGWFSRCYNLSSVNLENMDTENVTDMSRMFDECYSLTELDLSGFNSENVTDMEGMFHSCRSLKSLNLSGFDTKNVTDMGGMFQGCSSLESVDLSDFNTESVTDMRWMFGYCSSLKTLNLNSFNTENVTNMRWMFDGCSSLTSMDLSNFDTKNVTDMGWMFGDCSSLKSLNLSGFNTENVTDMRLMFDGCSSLKTLDLSNFNIENVTDMGRMFDGCSSLESVDLSSFNTKNVTNMSSMFDGCSSLKTVNLSRFNTESVTNMSYMFRDCSSLESLNLSSFNTENVTDMSMMFYDCSSLKGLDLSHMNCKAVTSASGIISGCYALQWLRTPINLGTGLNITIPINMYDENGQAYKSLPTGLDHSIGLVRYPGMTIPGDTGGDVSGGDVSGGDVSGGDVSGGDVSGGDVSGGDVSGGDVSGGDVSGGDVSGGDVSGGDISGGDVSGNDPVPPIEKTFTVTFDLQNHGTDIEPKTVKEGGKVTAPTAPTAEGYIFGGWYKEDTFKTLWDFDKDTVTTDTILYAKWTASQSGPAKPDPADTESPEDEEDDYYDGYYTTADSDDTKVVRIDLSAKALGTTITGVKGKTYDGKPYQPAVKVTVTTTVGSKSKKVTLTEGVDYRVLYENNIHAGTGCVVIKGNGAYKGEKRQEFTIQKKPVGKLKMIVGSMGLSASGASASDIPLKIYNGGLLLEEGVDYELTGLDNAGTSGGFGTKAGKYTVTVKALEDSDYTGSKAVKITVNETTENTLTEDDVILSFGGVDLSGAAASGVPYTGSAIKPTITVTHNGTPLTAKEFSVKYTNNKEAGTAYVTVTGKKPYSGSVVKTFEITPAQKTFKLKKEIKEVTYNGKLQKPKAAITVDTVAASGKTKTITLKAGKDYLIYYSNNLHATKGEGISRERAKITVKGIGNYADCETQVFEFDILPQQMKKASVKGAQGSLDISYAKKSLVTDIDYTVSYGTPDAKGKVEVKLKGKGDFTGEVTKKVKAGTPQ